MVTKPSRDWLFRTMGINNESWLRTLIGIATTFSITCAAWVVFRAESIPDAVYVLTHFWRGWDTSAIGTEQFLLRQMPAAVLSIAFLELAQWLHRRVSLTAQVARLPIVLRWPAYTAFVLGVVLFGVYRGSQFIYFQF